MPSIEKKRFLPATRAFIREGRHTPHYRFWDYWHGLFYSRWTYLYIGIGVGEHPLSPTLARIWKLFTWRSNHRKKRPEIYTDEQPAELLQTHSFADGYHGKVVPLASASRLVTIHEEIKITNLEKVIPFERARDLILKNPDHIVALECPCRSVRSHPCLPLDVCLLVGEPFASLVAEYHPDKARWITQAEAVEILQAEHARGHVQHAFFKDAMLGRFYAICNCCSCCCGAMQAQRNGTPMLISSGFVCQVEETECIACGECVEFCPFSALSLGEVCAEINTEKCMGCGVCNSKCAQGALSLVRDAARPEPLADYLPIL